LNKALDIGCAVGRSSFELARSFDNVIGIDFSHAFIDKCNEIKHQGSCKYILPGEGELGKDKVAKVSHDIDRDRCVFMQGDACNLSPNLGQFGCVLGANLVCRLPDPMVFLNRLRSLVVPGGIVVLTSPYSWLKEYTPKVNSCVDFVFLHFCLHFTLLAHLYDNLLSPETDSVNLSYTYTNCKSAFILVLSL
jgi:putative 4-mercaptohistidine N1-methyltranferase